MAGITALRKMQLGWEATAGTAVPATTVWRGPVNSIEALDNIVPVEEHVGRMGGANRTMKTNLLAQLSIPDTVFNFEQFPWFCQMGVEAQAAGVADGVGSGQIYTFDFGLTSANAPHTATIEAGNNQQVYEMEYTHCTEFTVRGAPNEAVMMSATLQGRQRTDSSFTGALSMPAVHEAFFNQASLYLDAAGAGTIGTTAIASALLGFSISVNTGQHAKFTGDGQLYFNTVDQREWEIEAEVTFRHIAAADTEDANWLAQTARLMEIKLTGAALATAGTAYTYYTARFQLPGKWTKFSTLEDREGNDIIRGTYRAAYDPTEALGPKIIVVNETASYWT